MRRAGYSRGTTTRPRPARSIERMPGPRMRPPWADGPGAPPWAHPHGGYNADGEWIGPPWWGPDGPPEWRPPRWLTLWLPVIISFAIQVPAAIWIARGGPGPAPARLGLDDLVTILLAIVGPLLLLAARRFPGPVVAAIAVVAAVDIFIGGDQGPPYIALAFAVVGAIVRGARLWAWISVGVCWIGSILLAPVLDRTEWSPFRVVATTLGILIVFGIAEGLRTRREGAREFRRRMSERRQSAVQQERVRIARELHDVLAHSLSQINVQAGVGLHLMDKQPDKAKDALASIKDTSKTALDEVRSVLGMLRTEGAADAPLVPEPDLSRLPDLVARARTAALQVHLDDRLPHSEIPAPVQLALYRIVQESLTNVSRHAAGATRARIVLERAADAYHVEVVDDGTGSGGPAAESGGRGVLGMRERAELLGGHLTAGPAPGGGFAVTAVIPIERGTP